MKKTTMHIFIILEVCQIIFQFSDDVYRNAKGNDDKYFPFNLFLCKTSAVFPPKIVEIQRFLLQDYGNSSSNKTFPRKYA